MEHAGTRPKILHILDHSLPVHSGYAFRSQAIILAQRQSGYLPIVVTSPKHYASIKGGMCDKEIVGEVTYYRTGSTPTSLWPMVSELRLMFALARRIEDVVQEEGAVLLHAHSPVLNALPALWVGRKVGLPVVYEMRSLWEDAAVNLGTYGTSSWKYKIVRQLESWVCRRVSRVVVLCEGLKQDLIARGIPAEKLTIVPNGVDPTAFQPCRPDHALRDRWQLTGKKVIGFLGSFFRWEGLDLLIEAMAHLRKMRSDVVLLIVGGGDMEAELKSHIRRLHLEEAVVMPGSVPQKNIPGIYAFVDVLAYPRRSMRLTELVTPLKPLEAMAMEKALVASDVGGHRDLIQDGVTGLLFPAGDVDQLTKVLNRLLDDEDLRHRLGKNGSAWVRQERSWERTTNSYHAVYAQLFGQSSSAHVENRPAVKST